MNQERDGKHNEEASYFESFDEAPHAVVRNNGRRHAHFDCFSGAAGDMILAACIDAGGATLLHHVTTALRRGLPELDGDVFTVHRTRVWRGKGRIAATHVTVTSAYGDTAVPVPDPTRSSEAPRRQRRRDDGEGQHEHSHGHSHPHSHEHHHQHHHDHGHYGPSQDRSSSAATTNTTTTAEPLHHHHSHEHTTGPLRNLAQIRNMLQDAAAVQHLAPWVRRLAVKTFTLLARAEAHVHGVDDVDAVHFHEVGAVDSLVDTVGSLVALHALGVTTVSCTALPLGNGTVRTAHGLLPVPAPATLYLLRHMAVAPGPPGVVTGELVTPTGAALLRALMEECAYNDNNNDDKDVVITSGRPPRFTLREVGVGAGTKDFEQHPNILRLLVGDSIVGDERKS